jgi:hypothetical protein
MGRDGQLNGMPPHQERSAVRGPIRVEVVPNRSAIGRVIHSPVGLEVKFRVDVNDRLVACARRHATGWTATIGAIQHNVLTLDAVLDRLLDHLNRGQR